MTSCLSRPTFRSDIHISLARASHVTKSSNGVAGKCTPPKSLGKRSEYLPNGKIIYIEKNTNISVF